MTFLDALRAALPAPGRTHHLPIRRASWLPGHRIRWIHEANRWAFANLFESDILCEPYQRRQLDLSRMQGCLTPETMLAGDWEVVEP